LAALFTALGGVVAAAEPGETVPVPYDAGSAAFHRWNGGPVERPKPPPPPVVDKVAKARANDTAAALRAQEDANLSRRLAACDKLRELALQTGDDSLEKLADELEKKATAAHKLRIANVSGGPTLTQAEPESRPAVASNAREGKR
jgi:acyl-CoA reductase-like NAD-dependent aldehyde dehydrogenase